MPEHAPRQEVDSMTLVFSEEEQRAIKNSRSYRCGLLNDRLVTGKNTQNMQRDIWKLLRMESDKYSDPGFPAYLVEKGVVSSEILPNLLSNISSLFSIKSHMLSMLFPSPTRGERIRLLVEHGILTQATFINNLSLKNSGAGLITELLNMDTDKLRNLINSGVFKKGAGNVITHGIDAIEFEAIRDSIRKSQDKRPIVSGHPLIMKMRGFEGVNQKSEQVEQVIPRESTESVSEQMEKIFRHYLARAPLYTAMLRRELIPEEVRIKERGEHIQLVNEYQRRLVGLTAVDDEKEAPLNENERFLDLYVRYGHAELDSFAMSIIAMTARWYIYGGRSRLFSGIRIIPDRMEWKGERPSNEFTPWAAYALVPEAQRLNVRHKAFRYSHMGANRMYLTHSKARDASEMHSIPIVGWATYDNSEKIPPKPSPIVVFRADFDQRDPDRDMDRNLLARLRRWLRTTDFAHDIPGLINETIRTLDECERKEIYRAKAASSRKTQSKTHKSDF